MAWLLLDVGNTAIKWAYREGDDHRLVGSGLALRAASDPLAQRLAKAWRGLQATRAFGVSVADAATMQAVEEAAQAAAGISVKWLAAQPHFAGRGPGYGLALINAYREPAQLGPDRWHALIAACAKFPGESLVV
ncbi:MAG: type III pantothenate kinase, partial [Burkholderiaceae bacterium]|nr:type III pantothenate kinase [Burkholderiaceae bacterium]